MSSEYIRVKELCFSTYLFFVSNSSNDSIEAPHYRMITPHASFARLLLPMVACSAEPSEVFHQKTRSHFVTQHNRSSKMLHRCYYYRHQLSQNEYQGCGATVTLSCFSIHVVMNSYRSNHQNRWQKRSAVLQKYKYIIQKYMYRIESIVYARINKNNQW